MVERLEEIMAATRIVSKVETLDISMVACASKEDEVALRIA
jgi:hypothetical protein